MRDMIGQKISRSSEKFLPAQMKDPNSFLQLGTMKDQAMTLLPVRTVRRIYEDQTLEVIEDLIGGVPYDQASDAIASQYLDRKVWRSMHKGPLISLVQREKIEDEKCWAFARAIAYDRYLPTVVLAHAQSMLQAGDDARSCEVVYFPDAIGILCRGGIGNVEQDHQRRIEATMCLVTRDIHRVHRTADFVRRSDVFDKTVRRWLDHLHAASIRCDGLKLPRIEHLKRSG